MKKILLSTMAFLLLFNSWAQDRMVSGIVKDSDTNDPLPGVNVIIKGTGSGVTSDLDGAYQINVSDPDAILVFSFIGMTTTEIPVNGRSVIDVSLETNISELSEVVVVGYGSQIKEELTGNVASVSGEDIENIAVPSFEQAIQGRMAGVQISSQNGKVGGGINIRVRGASSITGSNEPLYVIDGIPVTSSSQSVTAAGTNPLSDLNFNDVQSIDVLKDASATAIYGSRGSNGVVLITTKSGKAGKTKITFNSQFGFSEPTNKRDFINAGQYVELFREAALNNDIADGLDPVNNPADYPDSWLEYMEGSMDFLAGHRDWRAETLNNPNWEGTNWQDEAFQDAQISSYDLSASGGDEKTQFYVSGSYTNQDGILIGNNFERFSGRLNLNHKVSEKFELGLNVGISKSTNNRVTDDNQFSTPLQLVAQTPLTPVRDLDGRLYDDALNAAMFYYPATVELENSSFVTSVYRNLANVTGKYNITDNLSINGEYGFDLLTQFENRYQNSLTQTGRPADVNGVGQDRWVRIFNYTTKAYLRWDKVIGVNTFDFVGGTEFQKSTRDQTSVTAQGFPSSGFTKLESAAEATAQSGTLNEFSFLAYFGRVNYKLLDRYLFSVSGRVDASSRFGENNRYGFFPAGSLGWIISNEGFLADNSTVSFLKLRASYGLTGNAGIGNYEHFGLYTGVNYNGTAGTAPSQIANPDLEWEKTAQLDIGIDFGFFNDRLTGEIDYYQKNTTDLLLNIPVPGTSGFRTQTRNIGSLENTGVEIVLNYNLISNNNFSWSSSVNFAQNQNRITELSGDQQFIESGSSRFLNSVRIGEAIGVHYGAEFAGANPDNGDAIWYLNRTPTEDDLSSGRVFQANHLGGEYVTDNFSLAERKVLGNPNPDFIYGWSNSFKFRNFDLNILMQGQYGNMIYLGGDGFMANNARYEDNQTLDQMDRWQEPGDITDVPQARLYGNNGAQPSSRYLSDGSFLRLKTLTFGYNLPKGFLGNDFIESLRIYFSGQNLLTFTQYEGWDPEVNTDYLASNIFLGNDFYSAPQARTYTFGVKLGF